MLNFSGVGEGNTFTFKFTGATATWLCPERSSPNPQETLTPSLSLCAGRGGRQSSTGTRASAKRSHRPGQAGLDGDLVGRFAAGDFFAYKRDQLLAKLFGVLQRFEAADQKTGDARVVVAQQ